MRLSESVALVHCRSSGANGHEKELAIESLHSFVDERNALICSYEAVDVRYTVNGPTKRTA
jgi:hypothetical protein